MNFNKIFSPKSVILDLQSEEKDKLFEELVQAMKVIEKMLGKVLSVGTTIDQKRRLMLAIDKENVMTVSAALRSIPKTPEKEVNPILAALSDEEE